MARDASETIGQVFSAKDVRLMKRACNLDSDAQLVQRLVDPPKRHRPSTNMNRSGNMTCLRLTYQNQKQVAMGTTKPPTGPSTSK